MSRFEFWTLSFVSVLLIALLVTPFWLSLRTEQMSNDLNRDRQVILQSRSAEPVLDQLAKRIAIGSEKDPRLLELLSRNGLSVTLEVEGEKKQYP